MYIESVQLKNFINYVSLELDLAQGTNIFYGNNAQGKTNILEAHRQSTCRETALSFPARENQADTERP